MATLKGDSMESQRSVVKCLVWDLDHTIWEGTLMEADRLKLRSGVAETLRVLDERGILHSIASKNEPEPALNQLQAFGLEHFFLVPQIGWQPKSYSVKSIADALNIGLDSIGFIDDQAFERDEVGHAFPEVRRYCASLVSELPRRTEFQPRFITEDSKNRRAMYQADQRRNVAELSFDGPQEGFLATLNMRLTLQIAEADDLARAEELTLRTNQLNTTGRTYSYEELDAYRQSGHHTLMVARLEDCYGDYGVIGLALLEREPTVWTLKLFLMSCRVLSRGVGGVFLNYFRRLAEEANVELYADFIPTDRNRMMYVTFRFAGFQEEVRHGKKVLRDDLRQVPPVPQSVQLMAPESLTVGS